MQNLVSASAPATVAPPAGSAPHLSYQPAPTAIGGLDDCIRWFTGSAALRGNVHDSGPQQDADAGPRMDVLYRTDSNLRDVNIAVLDGTHAAGQVEVVEEPSWRDRLATDAAAARAQRREHATLVQTTCTQNLLAYRQSSPPVPPFARYAGVCVGLALTLGLLVVGLDVYLWRP